MLSIPDSSPGKWLLKSGLMRWRFRGVPVVRPNTLRVLQHDREAHTQGLVWHDDSLIESTGLVRQSSLRVLDPENGAILSNRPVSGHWLEGVAAIDETLFALTYTSELALSFSLPDLTLVGQSSYKGEGWGLASDGQSLFMTNGSARIAKIDRAFQSLDAIELSYAGQSLTRLNDLDVCDDQLYVQQLFDSILLEVSAKTGCLIRIVDCGEIVRRSGRRSFQDAFNGIAYRPISGTFFVTGKHWPHLFEIVIAPSAEGTSGEGEALS